MNKRLSSSLAVIALLAVSSQAAAQTASPCQNMRVIVRNSVFEIEGLDAFCAEFDKMKAELADTKRALSNARAENAVLEARLAMPATGGDVHAAVSRGPRMRAQRQAEE